MKKTLIGMIAVACVALMIATVYAPRVIPCPTIPPPTFCGCPPCGFTPGFWKHNLRVYLGLTNGKYSAFDRPNRWGSLDGVKLTDERMEWLLDEIGLFTAGDALGYLELPGWHPDRTNTANWFNWAAGYGPF